LAAHTTQSVALEAALATVPSGQPEQPIAPPKEKVLPVHASAATLGSAHEKPAGQRVHEVLPSLSAVEPGVQGVQAVAAAVEKLPAPQGIAAEPAGQNEPAGQAVQLAAPEPLVHPAGHTVHSEAPMGLKLPAEHAPRMLTLSQ
jgi:hypothetical protein